MGTMIRRVRPRRRVACRPGVAELERRALLAAVSIVNPAGPITSLTVGADGSFQVRRGDFEKGQVYPSTHDPADAGLFLRHPDGTVVGFDAYGRARTGYRTGAGATLSNPLHPLLLELSDDGNQVILIGDNRDDGNQSGQYFQLAQITTYNPGDDFFRVDNTIVNLGLAPIVLDVFAGADLHLTNNDLGVGYYDSGTGAVGGSDLSGDYTIFVQPNATGGLVPSGYQGGYFQDIWRAIGGGAHLNNQVPLPQGAPPWSRDDLAYTDTGAALEWQGVTIPPTATARISYFWSFGGSTFVTPEPAPDVVPSNIEAVAEQPFAGVVATFTSTDPLLGAGDFLATVQWGDASLLELAEVRARTGAAGFEVVGSHTYAAAGEYPLRVSVVSERGGTAAVQGKATVEGDGSPGPGGDLTIGGDLARSSDHGVSDRDRITNENKPLFVGTATAGSSWQLVLVPISAQGEAKDLGTFQADAAGTWSLGAVKEIADGGYSLEARPAGSNPSTSTKVLIPAQHPLVIDTEGPRVTGLAVVPRSGLLKVTLQDEVSGVDGASVGTARTYQLLQRVGRRNRKLSLRMTGVSANAAGSRKASATLTTGRHLAASLGYYFSIQAGVRDIAGNGLAGAFVGRFPTGNARGNASSFDANIQTSAHRLLAIKPLKRKR